MGEDVGMMRFVQVTCGVLLFATPTIAQQAPIPVSYAHEKTFRPLPMDQAIDAALAMPGFAPQAKPGPAAIVITAPDGWHYTENRKKDHIQFRLVFSKGGDKIGESEEVCPVEPPFDCARQIASDIKSAAAIAR
jgi:hypothetical protein